MSDIIKYMAYMFEDYAQDSTLTLAQNRSRLILAFANAFNKVKDAEQWLKLIIHCIPSALDQFSCRAMIEFKYPEAHEFEKNPELAIFKSIRVLDLVLVDISLNPIGMNKHELRVKHNKWLQQPNRTLNSEQYEIYKKSEYCFVPTIELTTIIRGHKMINPTTGVEVDLPSSLAGTVRAFNLNREQMYGQLQKMVRRAKRKLPENKANIPTSQPSSSQPTIDESKAGADGIIEVEPAKIQLMNILGTPINVFARPKEWTQESSEIDQMRENMAKINLTGITPPPPTTTVTPILSPVVSGVEPMKIDDSGIPPTKQPGKEVENLFDLSVFDIRAAKLDPCPETKK
jgi:hypothetical protein